MHGSPENLQPLWPGRALAVRRIHSPRARQEIAQRVFRWPLSRSQDEILREVDVE
jgi:hypothetical protein